MKYFIVILFLIIVALFAALIIVWYQSANKDQIISRQDVKLQCAQRDRDDYEFMYQEQRRLIRDSHFRKVVFCPECKSSRYSESLGVYLCGIEEKEVTDYCSSGDRKD